MNADVLRSDYSAQPEADTPALLATGRAVLFDLDGTLADTAADLAAAANKMRHVRNMKMLPLEALRPLASEGARGLLMGAFGIDQDHPDYLAMRDEFLANYAADLCIETILFPGMDAVLRDLDARRVRWGVVTNKIARFTEPLIEQLGLSDAAGCIVCGDSTPFPKPHPAPLLHAAASLGVAPAQTLYVGDDLRDVQAGRAAGMTTVVAAYGYCGKGAPVDEWGAHHVVDSVEGLQALLQRLL